MHHQTFAVNNRRLILTLIGLLFLGNFSACATDKNKSKIYVPADTQTVGIINPDGAKSVLMVPGDVSDLLARYSWQQIEGIKFYQFASWKDSANFLAAVSVRQEQIIREQAGDVKELTQRIKNIKRHRAPAGTRPIDRRVEELEKKVKEMSDGGKL